MPLRPRVSVCDAPIDAVCSIQSFNKAPSVSELALAGGASMSELEARLLSPCYRRGHPIYGAAFQLLRCGL
jgi:hypothetical protein